MVRCIRVVDVMLRSPPVRGYHFVQQEALLAVAEDVLTKSVNPRTSLFPHSLETRRPGSNPDAPVQPLESFQHAFNCFSFSRAKRIFCDSPDLSRTCGQFQELRVDEGLDYRLADDIASEKKWFHRLNREL